MADYKKMYAILCVAIDDVIDPLEELPETRQLAQKLRTALEAAEELYIDTTPYIAVRAPGKILPLKKSPR